MCFVVVFWLLPLLCEHFAHGDDNPCDNIMYVQFGAYCLRTFSYPSTIPEARKMCAEDNAFLPSAHGSDELYDLYAYVSQTGYIAADGSILIGLTCFGSTKECYWDDVSPYDYGLFERRQIPNGISCVEMLNSELGWSYKFGSCNEMKTAFACSLPINKESMLACPDDFDPVEDRCLRYFPILSTHSDAEKSCQQQHSESHLASIHSKKRVQELQKELDGAWTNIHIGLQKEAGSGYEWSDGSKLDFKNWRSGFPNVKSGDCVQMETNPTAKGEWSNIPCSLKLSYFCELPASVKPTKSPLDFPPTSGDNDCPSNNKFKSSGYVTSPGYPAITTGNICDYFLSSPEGTVVSLKFLDFSMCYPQYAMIYDGWDTSDSSKLLAELTFYSSQADISKVFKSSGNKMVIHYDFHNDQCDNAGRGFVFRFETEKK